MAPSQPPKGRSNKVKKARRSQLKSNPKTPTPTQLVNEATSFLHTGDPEAALPLALRALVLTQSNPISIPAAQPNSNSNPANPVRESLPALKILAEINLELGDAEAARAYFLQAVDVDPEGEIAEDEGGGPEKFLWLAQLCEEGGEESVRWFERGAGVLRRAIAMAEQKGGDLEGLEEKRKKLARALCGIIEVYMTDLSFDTTAEAQCTTLIASALALAPKSPTPHQTHASILISQSNFPAARTALRTSLSLWQHLPPSHPDVLDFPSRISLSRLLLEVGMEDEALEVLSGVVEGDESSVEGWYLGGWGLWLMAQGGGRGEGEEGKEEEGDEDDDDDHEHDKKNPKPCIAQGEKERINHLRDSRTWLTTCLTLAAQLDYEDDRLRDHAQELVQEIERVLLERGVGLDEEEDEEEEGAEDEEEDEAWEGAGANSSEEESDKINGHEPPEETTIPRGTKDGDENPPPVDIDMIMSGT